MLEGLCFAGRLLIIRGQGGDMGFLHTERHNELQSPLKSTLVAMLARYRAL